MMNTGTVIKRGVVPKDKQSPKPSDDPHVTVSAFGRNGLAPDLRYSQSWDRRVVHRSG